MITKRTAVYWTVECDTCGDEHLPRDEEGSEIGFRPYSDEALDSAIRDGWVKDEIYPCQERIRCSRCVGREAFEKRVDGMDRDVLLGWLIANRGHLNKADYRLSVTRLANSIKILASKNPRKYYKL